MSGDFKVIDINDPGLSSKFGGDDLDKINRILNGEDLSLDILIDNEWSFKHNKLVIRDFTGDNKIRIGTSEEAADWSITIPTLGGNREPLFTDLAQNITEKTFNLSDNTLTDNLAVVGDLIIHDGTKFVKGIPKLDDLALPDDNTDLDVSLLRHGLVPKAPNITGQFLRSDGIWAILPYATTSARGAVTLADDGESAATLAVQSNDLRLSNNRDPNNHAINHELGGGDQLTIDWTQLDGVPADFTPSLHASSHGNGGLDEVSIDWSQITTGIPLAFTPIDHATEHITGGGDIIPVATTLATGLLPILSNVATQYLDGSGNWSVPSLGSVSIDALNDVDTSTVVPNNNDVLTWNSTNSEWVPAAPPGASGGEANTAANVGLGEGDIFRDKTGVTLNLKTIKAGTNVSISNDVDEVTISATDTVVDALTDLTTDVLITTPSNLQVLAYDSATSKWKNNTFNAERTGTASGDGGSVTYNIAHGLGSVPSSAFVQCRSHSIPFTYDYSDGTNITVTFDSAPGAGVDVVKFDWRVVA